MSPLAVFEMDGQARACDTQYGVAGPALQQPLGQGLLGGADFILKLLKRRQCRAAADQGGQRIIGGQIDRTARHRDGADALLQAGQ
ncbi:hypothetical protein D3C72_2369780 [compost metagenome]